MADRERERDKEGGYVNEDSGVYRGRKVMGLGSRGVQR